MPPHPSSRAARFMPVMTPITRLLLASSAIALAACTTQPYQAVSTAPSVQSLVRETWRLPSFNFKTDAMSSTYLLRVSTHSQPPFIHAQQLQVLADNVAELQAVCGHEGGVWQFVSQVPRASTTASQSPRPSSPQLESAAQQIANRPLTSEQQVHDEINTLVRINQLEMSNQLIASLLASARNKPDVLTEGALDHAERLQWFGLFRCDKGAASWKASIAPVGWRATTDKNLEYREIKVSTAFFGVQGDR